ncbi:ABC transporter ATP-binding protein [Pseudohoeflea coraliihabitans]|uniref:ABC transporter ATP-binding protein n=1 Tax=Pseudohoeflea coraliihabitans TaxID=2860393 RepID=A0ABS6WK12_9HYPH|nr:ABC transporter ATP-binding protein [Pseudohoeflea sp. DP4N28-3]MBW3095988.1 ABC transporter ATP-binding protein [Pseudohoeflea sp. DP4N28-3]
MASIAFKNVTKRFGDTTAVDNVSFEIADNEFFCFFGPPLSGKSTLLRLLLGLEVPDSGEIYIDGKAVTTLQASQRNIAMVFQNLALFPHMTALDNIRFPLVERKMSETHIRQKVEDVSAKLHIEHILHKLPAHLSGGERQRVAIARALVRDPVAYLMDDPISALDARLREETRVELKRIQRDAGKTLVYVTHDQEEAMSIADRMAILENGKIRQIGTPIDIYDRPVSKYVAGMLGSPAINFFQLDDTQASGIRLAGEGLIQLDAREVPANAVQVGLRPENLAIRPDGGAGDVATARISSVEPLGGFTVVTVAPQQSKSQTVYRALLRGQHQMEVGTEVTLGYQPDQLISFDQNGLAIG